MRNNVACVFRSLCDEGQGQNEATTTPEEVVVQENGSSDRRAREMDHEVQKSDEKHFTEERSVPEITIELVLKARAKMADNKVNGPEDSTVSEMIKQPPQEKSTRLQDVSKIAVWSWKKPKVHPDKISETLAC